MEQKTKIKKRRLREIIVETIFQINFFEEKEYSELEETLNNLMEKNKISERNQNEYNEYLEGICANIERYDSIIKKNLENWSFYRVGNIEKSVLRLAMYELEERKDIPVKVIIDEAIELCKSFSEKKSASFVNGILDKMARNDFGRNDFETEK